MQIQIGERREAPEKGSGDWISILRDSGSLSFPLSERGEEGDNVGLPNMPLSGGDFEAKRRTKNPIYDFRDPSHSPSEAYKRQSLPSFPKERTFISRRKRSRVYRF